MKLDLQLKGLVMLLAPWFPIAETPGEEAQDVEGLRQRDFHQQRQV